MKTTKRLKTGKGARGHGLTEAEREARFRVLAESMRVRLGGRPKQGKHPDTSGAKAFRARLAAIAQRSGRVKPTG